MHKHVHDFLDSAWAIPAAVTAWLLLVALAFWWLIALERQMNELPRTTTAALAALNRAQAHRLDNQEQANVADSAASTAMTDAAYLALLNGCTPPAANYPQAKRADRR